jgi:hypothetical protein
MAVNGSTNLRRLDGNASCFLGGAVARSQEVGQWVNRLAALNLVARTGIEPVLRFRKAADIKISE